MPTERPTVGAQSLAKTHAAYAETVESAPGTTISPDGTATEGGVEALLLRRSAAKPDASVEVHEGVLGRGGMSIVFEGTQHSLGRAVAIKSPQVEGPASQARTLLREAWITAQLEHPNVVPVYDLVAEEGRPLAVLKRIEGVDWASLLGDPDAVMERFGASDPQVFHLRTFLHVCNAVHYAHSRGIVHRDLKPENVMVGGYGEVYVVDWGIAVSDTPDGPVSYDPSAFAGTPFYIAPESLLGNPVDARTDVYLLGGVLFEILAGRPMRSGNGLAALIAEALTEDPPELPKEVPAELAAICRRCLAVEPEGRFESAEALRQTIERYLEHRGSVALSDAAAPDLTKLEAAAAAFIDGGEDVVTELKELFRSCRLGFRAALLAWDENRDAAEGITRAVTAMIDVELHRGSAESAKTLLAELERPPEVLATRVEAALRSETRARSELLAIRSDHDPAVGRKGRFLGTLLLAPAILASPFAQALGATQDPAPSRDSVYFFRVAGPLFELFVFIGVWYWQRAILSTSLYNRRLLQCGVLVFVAQATLSIGHYLGGVDPVTSQTENFAVVAMGLGALAIFVDNRITPAMLAYTAAFLVSTRWPDLRYWSVAGANVVLIASLLMAWRPRKTDAAEA